MEKLAYIILGSVAIAWISAVIYGMVAAFPYGLIGLITIFAVGMLFVKILKERLESKEDDYYDKHIDQ